MSKATGKRGQKKLVYFAEREWLRVNKAVILRGQKKLACFAEREWFRVNRARGLDKTFLIF